MRACCPLSANPSFDMFSPGPECSPKKANSRHTKALLRPPKHISRSLDMNPINGADSQHHRLRGCSSVDWSTLRYRCCSSIEHLSFVSNAIPSNGPLAVKCPSFDWTCDVCGAQVVQRDLARWRIASTGPHNPRLQSTSLASPLCTNRLRLI